ncbi:MAG TPA: sulfite exporter TauE/SafE family protein [Bacteriovoracaceae bacterium]|nr:sulfite exporter TauE/SafE family protein [Bacteriovoracaceae bacterium]
MDYVIIPAVAALASLLTFFSGFGLGTLLTPVFAIFFPLELAISLTAIVHFLNGLFKLSLVGRFADKSIILRFGIPAIIAAVIGAWVLLKVSDLPPLYSYKVIDYEFKILPIKMILGLLIAAFTLFELVPKLRDLEIDKRYLSLGGFISGFFGGLSGHQGALRSAFLARSGLTKEQFVGTGTVIASMIDIARISVYSKSFSSDAIINNLPLLALTTFSAFIGAYLGNKLLKKITMKSVQTFVSISLLILAIALGAGII